MCESYNAAGNDDRPSLEDEFLCEYVDGTMDPVVKEVFEEYLRSNPDLQDHVECLRNTRMILCRYACGCHAPNDLHDRLRRQISCELIGARIPFHIGLTDRFRTIATVASTMALLFLVGTVAGLSFTEEKLDGRIVSETTAVESVAGGRPSQRLVQRAGMPDGVFYPSYSAITPFSTVRSLLSAHDRKADAYGSDSSIVVPSHAEVQTE
jgi:hypothetical protein